jgi:hypothetical protein
MATGSKTSSVTGWNQTIVNEPSIPPIDRFWSDFVTNPPRVKSAPLSYDEQTEILGKICTGFLSDLSSVVAQKKRIEHISDDYGLESPLSPSAQFSNSLVNAVVLSANSIGETFASRNLCSVCKCSRDGPERCMKNKAQDDWLAGHCGMRVMKSKPFSFIHVNLNRKIPNFKKFSDSIYRYFVESRVSFRPIPGDSGNTVVLVASDEAHEKQIRKLLRKKEIRLEMGIRIFRVSKDILANKDKYSDK